MLWRQEVYKLVYLVTSLPLGLIYFVFLIAGVSVGLVTLIIWVGVAILIFMMLAWWQLAAVERWLAVRWLHVVVPPMTVGSAPQLLSRRHIMEQLRNPMTWKILAFLFLKLPCGILYFGVTLVLLSVSLVAASVSLVVSVLTSPFVLLGLVILGSPSPAQSLRHYVAFAATGFGIGIVAFALVDQMVNLARYLAVTLLGMSDDALRLQAMAMQIAQGRERAAQADQRRRRLIVDISHELRTPVASIAGHLESLLLMTEEGMSVPSPATLSTYLHIADQEVARLGTLVDELLALARMDSDELRLDIQVVAAREVIEEVYQALAPLAARERHIMLVRGADPRLPPILADRQRLIQILANLVRNAIAYTPAGGLVSLSLEPTGADQLAIVVADNGVGIPKEDLDRIFERFYRVDSSRARATGGAGLGLAIVHGLVIAMGGTMTVESTEGEGSRFSIKLRIAPDTAALAEVQGTAK
jgi:signal transduction histidine kinase